MSVMPTFAGVPDMAHWRQAAWRAARSMRPLATVPATPHYVCRRVACISSAASGDGTGGESVEHVVVTQLRTALTQHRLVRDGSQVVTCCSGGVDSVALLLALHTVAPEFALSLHVLHFNHGLRVRSESHECVKTPYCCSSRSVCTGGIPRRSCPGTTPREAPAAAVSPAHSSSRELAIRWRVCRRAGVETQRGGGAGGVTGESKQHEQFNPALGCGAGAPCGRPA